MATTVVIPQIELDGVVVQQTKSYTVADSADIANLQNQLTALEATVSSLRPSITITATDQSKTYGQAFTWSGTEFSVTSGALEPGDSISTVSFASQGASATASASTTPYPITPSGAQGAGLAKYNITYVAGNLTVSQASLSIAANNETATVPVAGGVPVVLNAGYRVAGLQNTDAVTSVTLASTGTAAGAVAGNYPITITGVNGTGLTNYKMTLTPGVLTLVAATPTPTPTPTPQPNSPVAASPMPPSTGVLNPALTALVASMAPNTFAEVPGTIMGPTGQNVLSSSTLTFQNPNNYTFTIGMSGSPNDTFYAWCGVALDTERNRLLAGPGGGHADWWGNATYGFSFEDLKWRRITDNSALIYTSTTTFKTADGAPLPNHNYDGLCVDPTTGNLHLYTGFGAPNGEAGGFLWHLDPETATWTQDTTVRWPASEVQEEPSLNYSTTLKKFLLMNYEPTNTFDPATNTLGTAGDAGAGYGDGDSTVDEVGGRWFWTHANPYLLTAKLSSFPNGVGNLWASSAMQAAFGSWGYEWSDIAPNVPTLGGVWDSKRGVLTRLGWDAHGNPHVDAFNPDTMALGEYVLASGSAIPANHAASDYGQLYKKFSYYPSLDVFVAFGFDLSHGIFLFKPGTTTPIVPLLGSATVVNPATTAGGTPTTTKYNNPHYAASKTAEGGTLTIGPGTFGGGLLLANGCTVTGVTASPDGNTALPTQVTGWGKDVGCVVPQGDTTTISNLEIFGAVDGENGSGIRGQGKNIAVNNCWVHGNSMNWLSAPLGATTALGAIVFNDSWFTDSVNGNELDHNIYVSVEAGLGGPASFTMTGGGSLRANGLGHLIKTRALVSTLTGVTALMEGANSSRVLDVCDGGTVLVNGCLFEQGPNADNSDIIGYGREYLNNAIRFDYAGSTVSVLALTATATLDATAANTLDITSGTDIPNGYQVHVSAPTGSTLPASVANAYNNNPSYPYFTWNSTGPLKGTLGSAANPMSLAGGSGPLTISVYAPDTQRKHAVTIKNTTFVFDLTNNVHSDPVVVVCTNSLAAATTLNGVAIPAVPITLTGCTLVNRSVVPLQWTVGVGDKINNLIDGGGNTVIDEHAKPGSLAAAGMQPYPWMPSLPVAA